MTPVRFLVIGALRLYRWVLSPVLSVLAGPGAGCRFHPTCSAYALEAVQRFGVFRGGWLAARRLMRCHPWGGFGEDPVPEQFCSGCGQEAECGTNLRGAARGVKALEDPRFQTDRI